jgi:hypothetical protein
LKKNLQHVMLSWVCLQQQAVAPRWHPPDVYNTLCYVAAAAAAAGFVDVRALPAIKSTAEDGSAELATWLVPLWLLCVAFFVTLFCEARSVLHHYEGDNWIAVSPSCRKNADQASLCEQSCS